MKNNYSIPHITIGIPALNEEDNIGGVLSSLLKQDENGYLIDSIIIASDGSTDATASIVRSVGDARIHVIEGKKRKGKAIRQNEILALCKSDILVLLDADIKITTPTFLHNLIAPLLDDSADFSSGLMLPLPASHIVDGMLAHMMAVKAHMFQYLNNGDTIFNCYGPARAFSRKAYSQLRFAAVASEDAYSYLQMKQAGMRFGSSRSAVFYVKVPSTMSDHQKQSVRFMTSGNVLKTIFGFETVRQAYSIPLLLQIRIIIYAILTSPVYAAIYVFVFSTMKLKSIFSSNSNMFWDRVSSSKRLA